MLTKQIQKALQQYARHKQLTARLPGVYETLKNILPLLGSQSHGRAMIIRIGSLLMHDVVKVVAPTCPDYSHENGKYTLSALGEGVPLLTQFQCNLFEKLSGKIPRAQYTIVIADQEADDQLLCRRFSIDRAQFLEKIDASVRAIKTYTEGCGWEVGYMTRHFPDLKKFEAEIAKEIAIQEQYVSRIRSYTSARCDMYWKMGIRDFPTMKERTIVTASQYCALAKISVRDGFIICNHETVNLTWYNEYHASVFHNDVSIY